MEKSNTTQKKRIVLNYVYAVIVGMLVIACATTIALIGAKKGRTDADISGATFVSADSFTVPMKNATISKDYSSSELQFNDTLKQWEIHRAIDFVATDDLDVLAIANGTVTNVYNNYLEGNVVEITHSKGLVSVYKSLSEVNVKIGDKVTSGQVIGTAGDSMAQELKTGKHLHFEMSLNGKKVNPNDYLDLGTK